MQIDGIRWCRYPTRALVAALLMGFAITAAAQQSGSAIPDDYYRAEFVILERIIEPESVNEQMANRTVEEPTETKEILWSELENGSTQTTLDLAPRKDLYLANAAARLERSGHYKVLMAAGWYQAFPPDYDGKPLRVETGDWIEDARTREVEGYITVDRQRYLHVNVNLNHWQLAEDAPALSEGVETDMLQPAEVPATEGTAGTEATSESETLTSPVLAEPAPLELLTWIRETRRMRSEEIHFLDSPTIGVLVFFRKIEATE